MKKKMPSIDEFDLMLKDHITSFIIMVHRRTKKTIAEYNKTRKEYVKILKKVGIK